MAVWTHKDEREGRAFEDRATKSEATLRYSDSKQHHTGTVQALHQGAKKKLMGWRGRKVSQCLIRCSICSIYN